MHSCRVHIAVIGGWTTLCFCTVLTMMDPIVFLTARALARSLHWKPLDVGSTVVKSVDFSSATEDTTTMWTTCFQDILRSYRCRVEVSLVKPFRVSTADPASRHAEEMTFTTWISWKKLDQRDAIEARLRVPRWMYSAVRFLGAVVRRKSFDHGKSMGVCQATRSRALPMICQDSWPTRCPIWLSIKASLAAIINHHYGP